MIKISVIIPVYKSEKYLSQCIESILAQNFTNFELLLIDDGSPDNSGRICDEYAEKDSRIRVFHKENGGVSSARNLGLDNAQGEWIAFVDSDDWVEENYLQELSNSVISDKTGLIIQGFVKYGIMGKIVFDDVLLTEDQFPLAYSKYKIMNRGGYPFSKLFQRNVIEQHNLKFNQNIQFSEDTLFILTYIQYIKYIQFISGHNYNYRCDIAGNLSHKHNSYESENLLYTTYKNIINEFCLKYKNTDDFADVYAWGAYYLMRAINAMYRPNTLLIRKKRMEILNSLTEADFLWLGYNKPKDFLFVIQKKILTTKCFHIFDTYCQLLFYFRYKFNNIWQSYLKLKYK